jgi:hypothetical protein
VTPKAEQLDNEYKLNYLTLYLAYKFEHVEKGTGLFQEALSRSDVRDNVGDALDVEDLIDRTTGERDMLWMVDDVLCYLKTQQLTAEQQRLADHLVIEVQYCRQAHDKFIMLLSEFKGPNQRKKKGRRPAQ